MSQNYTLYPQLRRRESPGTAQPFVKNQEQFWAVMVTLVSAVFLTLFMIWMSTIPGREIIICYYNKHLNTS